MFLFFVYGLLLGFCPKPYTLSTANYQLFAGLKFDSIETVPHLTTYHLPPLSHTPYTLPSYTSLSLSLHYELEDAYHRNSVE